MNILLSRIQECRREVCMMWSIRILLGLKRDGFTIVQCLAIFSACSAVKEISAIELECRLVCPHLHVAS